ncbi:MAG: hypothetical protein ACJ8KO_08750 [Sulfurifustaceae bacterium]
MKRVLPVAALLIATAASADDEIYSFVEGPLDFALSFSHHELPLDYGPAHVDTSVDRASILWRERYGERLQLGLIGGYSLLSQTNNPATAGLDLDGYHAGVSLDLDLVRSSHFDMFFNAVWLYQKVDHADASQRVTIITREPDARVGAGVTVAGVRAYAGARYGRIDGEQRQSGTVNDTRAIHETRRSGAFGGLELRLDENGYVGVIGESGVDRRVGIYFGRVF